MIDKLRQRGFTLIELLGVLAIVAVTLMIAVPTIKSVMISSRLTASVNDMVIALQLARSESVKRGNTSTSNTGVSIHTNSSGNDAANKWIAFLGMSTLPTSTPAGTGILLQSYEAADGITVSSTDDTPTYLPNGRLNATSNIVIEFTAVGVTAKRTLTITPSGRVSVVVTD